MSDINHRPSEQNEADLQRKVWALESENKEMREALEAVDIYFKALNEQWNAHDGRVVSESGVVLDASADCQRLCNVAGEKVQTVLDKVRGK